MQEGGDQQLHSCQLLLVVVPFVLAVPSEGEAVAVNLKTMQAQTPENSTLEMSSQVLVRDADDATDESACINTQL